MSSLEKKTNRELDDAHHFLKNVIDHKDDYFQELAINVISRVIIHFQSQEKIVTLQQLYKIFENDKSAFFLIEENNDIKYLFEDYEENRVQIKAIQCEIMQIFLQLFNSTAINELPNFLNK